MRATKQPKAAETPEALRLAAGLTPAQVEAHEDGVSMETLAKVERGDLGVTMKTLSRLARLVGVDRQRYVAAYMNRLQGAA